MSDTERLEAAARELERGAEEEAYSNRGCDQPESVDRALATAALLHAIAVRLRSPIDERFQPNYVAPALALADAVLGVPASPKGATE